MNKQVKAGLSAVRDFLAGRSGEAKLAEADDQATREVVGAELLAAMSRRNSDGTSGENAGKASGSDTQEIPPFDPNGVIPETTTEQQHGQQIPQSAVGASLVEPEPSENSEEREQGRARRLFLDHGYFDEAVQDLRAGNSPAERVAAARALGLVGSERATAHLIAAMFDDDPEVRSAAGEALAQIGDPTVSSARLNAVLNEPDAEMSKLADTLHGPETSATSGERESRALSKESHTLTKDEHPHQKSKARDRSGRFLPASKATGAAPAKSKAHDQGERVISENEATSAKATSQVHVGQDSRAPGENETASTKLTAEEEQDQGGRAAHAPIIVDDAAAAREVEQLLLEEHAVRETVEQLERQLLETAAVRKESENQARWRIERESRLRTDAAERRREEEELRKQADEEAERRRSEESQAIAIEQTSGAEAEAEAHRLAEDEARMRIEAASLRMAAEELARHRAEIETARREAAEAAHHAEAKRLRDDSEKRHNAELERLRAEEEALRIALEETRLQRAEVEAAQKEAQAEIARLTEERAQLAAAEAARRAEAQRIRSEAEERNRVDREQLAADVEALRHVNEELALRREEVEAAREKADKDTERLLEAQARMRAAEEARAQAEAERSRLEAELNERVETQFLLLEQTRRRAQEEQERLQEETHRHAEAEQKRLAELVLIKTKAEVESKQRAEKEREILSQVDSLRIADSETRKRIEDAEVRRRAAEDAYRLVAEKVQRVEAEAHARAKEEEQMLAKLEAERRTVAVEAQSRAAQEKRIREEIEMFRILEEQERPRIEEAILQRTEAEARLQQRQDRLSAEEAARVSAAEQLKVVGQYRDSSAEPSGVTAWQEHATARPTPTMSPAGETSRASRSFTGASPSGLAEGAISEGHIDSVGNVETVADAEVTPTIVAYLNSVDPYKRAAAVAELARSGSKDAFNLIADCFDDHSPHVRNAAARALRKLEPTRTVDLFNRALEDASTDRRRNIGGAIAASGLATEAINNLVSENREDTYNALSILFVMAKTGEVEPLVRALKEHRKDEIGRAVTKLLNLSGHADIADAALNGKNQ